MCVQPKAQANGRWTSYVWWLDPLSPKIRSKLCRARAPSWDWPMTSAASTRQVMFVFGHETDSMTKFVASWPQQEEQATSAGAQPRNCMVWPTSWNRVSMAAWDMEASWPSRHGQTRTPRPGDWILLRGDRSCDALSAYTGISRASPGAPSVSGSIRCSCWSRQSRIKWYFSNLTGHKSVTVLLQPIVQSSKVYGSLQRPISLSWSFLLCSTP